jgi:hypothetical protein
VIVKIRVALIGISLVGVAVGVWALTGGAIPNVTTTAPRVQLRSDPYPMVIGPASLFIIITDSAGNAVEDASVSLVGQMIHDGMLPQYGRAAGYQDGAYRFAITWPMTGMYLLDVTAALPDGQTLREQFEIYVYAVAVDAAVPVQYRSASDNRALITNPSTEYSIVIPQGAKVMMLAGQAEDMIPTEIRLNVGGQNTLVIHNSDIAEHTIGPFTVRAGETIRQTFTRPSVYQGTCSLNAAAELNIIVEE